MNTVPWFIWINPNYLMVMIFFTTIGYLFEGCSYLNKSYYEYTREKTPLYLNMFNETRIIKDDRYNHVPNGEIYIEYTQKPGENFNKNFHLDENGNYQICYIQYRPHNWANWIIICN
jgi:hypothetical protein